MAEFAETRTETLTTRRMRGDENDNEDHWHIPGQVRNTDTGLVFNVGKLIGKGGFGRVHKAVDTLERRRWAIKVMQRAQADSGDRRLLTTREIGLQSGVRHTMLCHLPLSFRDSFNVYLVLEYCSNQTMKRMVQVRGSLTEGEVRMYFRQVVMALEYLHTSCNVLHRDVTASNVLLTKAMAVKLGDFGLAMSTSTARLDEDRSGAPAYLAPEVVGYQGHSRASDCWSTGCLLHYMLHGKHPFGGTSAEQLFRHIKAGKRRTLVHTLSEDAVDLTHRLLHTKPANRLTMLAVTHHPFLQLTRFPILLPLPAHKERAPFAWESVCSCVTAGLLLMLRRWVPAECMAARPVPGPIGVAHAAAAVDQQNGAQQDGALRLLHWCDRVLRVGLQHGPRESMDVTTLPPLGGEAAARVCKWSAEYGRWPSGCQLADGTLFALFEDGTTLRLSPNRNMYEFVESGNLPICWLSDTRPPPGALQGKAAGLARLEQALQTDFPMLGRPLDMVGARKWSGQHAALCMCKQVKTGATVCCFEDNTVQILFTDSKKRVTMHPSTDKRELWLTVVTSDEHSEWVAFEETPSLTATLLPNDCRAALHELRETLAAMLLPFARMSP